MLDLEPDGMKIFVLKISYSVHGVVKLPIFSRTAMKKAEFRIQELQDEPARLLGSSGIQPVPRKANFFLRMLRSNLGFSVFCNS